jgi:PAS domain S-box-containing protein
VKDYAIFRTDSAGIATSWNEGVKAVLGFEQHEFIQKNIVPLIFTPEDVEAGVPQLELHTAATQGSASNDRWMRRKDGTRFFASGITTGLKNEAGKLLGFSKVLRDVTDKKHAEELLERTVADRTAELRETNEQLEAYVYSIAHDLRAPLRSMRGYSQLLLDENAADLNETIQRMLKRIRASADFMDKLLVDLLAYGRTARVELELRPVQVRKAWESALLQCAVQIDQTKASIDTVEPLPLVRAHEVTLGQVLANLLGNALKFVETGVQPRVRFRTEQQGTFVRLWVEDNGIGIPSDQHERIFRVFERTHGARFGGTGIGLAIVKKGVERMGGHVGLKSTPGQGTSFWVDLPKANRRNQEVNATYPSVV